MAMMAVSADAPLAVLISSVDLNIFASTASRRGMLETVQASSVRSSDLWDEKP